VLRRQSYLGEGLHMKSAELFPKGRTKRPTPILAASTATEGVMPAKAAGVARSDRGRAAVVATHAGRAQWRESRRAEKRRQFAEKELVRREQERCYRCCDMPGGCV
jgi:hypothetical protein